MKNIKKLIYSLIATSSFTSIALTSFLASPANSRALAEYTVLGGVDLDAYCKRHYRSVFPHIPHTETSAILLRGNTAYDWRCRAYRSWDLPEIISIDVNQACREQYNQPRASSTYRNFNDPYSWTCILNPQAQSSQLLVSARAVWVDTGIDLVAGQPISIRASGTWTNGGGNPQRVGPNGFRDFTLAGAELPSENFAGLIGRIGNHRLFVGEELSIASPATGRLYLQMNEIPGTFDDNSGNMNVTIQY